ncbi:cold shock domain-containing protein [Limibacter armeniacum]|uniref:cold-shock protein n=1 Tax=Limibacter armeniacum TaxID=466084 RepID=UPI002FE541DF
MGRSQETFSKKEKEKKRQKKRQEKEKKREERKANSQGGSLESMMAYVDEYGNIVDTPPDPSQKEEIDPESISIGVPQKSEEDEDPTMTGRVEFFNHNKGFGFIKERDTKEKYFVHVNGLIDQIDEGDIVSFELEKGLKGMNAVRVTKIK